jgi:hypothetical protein
VDRQRGETNRGITTQEILGGAESETRSIRERRRSGNVYRKRCRKTERRSGIEAD